MSNTFAIVLFISLYFALSTSYFISNNKSSSELLNPLYRSAVPTPPIPLSTVANSKKHKFPKQASNIAESIHRCHPGMQQRRQPAAIRFILCSSLSSVCCMLSKAHCTKPNPKIPKYPSTPNTHNGRGYCDRVPASRFWSRLGRSFLFGPASNHDANHSTPVMGVSTIAEAKCCMSSLLLPCIHNISGSFRLPVLHKERVPGAPAS